MCTKDRLRIGGARVTAGNSGSDKITHLAVLGVYALADPVDLLVHLGAMVIALLTGARDRERYSAGMPGADASNLTQTFVRLARQLLRVPPGRDACCKAREREKDVNILRITQARRSVRERR